MMVDHVSYSLILIMITITINPTCLESIGVIIVIFVFINDHYYYDIIRHNPIIIMCNYLFIRSISSILILIRHSYHKNMIMTS